MNRLRYILLHSLPYLLLFGSAACSPYADLDRLAADVDRSFPTEVFHQPISRSDTVVYYRPGQLKDYFQQLDYFRSQLNAIQPKEHWKTEKRAMHQELKSYLYALQEYFSDFQTDPGIYNIGGKIQQLLISESLTKSQKAAYIQKNLDIASRYYLNARACLTQPEPEQIRLAIQKQRLGLQLIERPLKDSLQNWRLSPAQFREIDRDQYVATLAIKDFIAFCNSLLFEAKEQQILITPDDR